MGGGAENHYAILVAPRTVNALHRSAPHRKHYNTIFKPSDVLGNMNKGLGNPSKARGGGGGDGLPSKEWVSRKRGKDITKPYSLRLTP